MSNTRIEVLGLPELKRAFDRAGEGSGEALPDAVMAGTVPVVAGAAARAPRWRGVLATHIVAEMLEEEETSAAAAVGPHKEAFWGLFQELGTDHHAAQPFLRPALDGNIEQIVSRIGDVFRAKLERVTR